jgi:hypothetical protein
MEGVSQFRGPQATVIQKPQGLWATLGPDLLKTIVGGAIMAKLKSKFDADEAQKDFAQKKELQKSESDLVTQRETGLETMKETAEGRKQSGENLIKMLLGGWRLDKDGNWSPPQQGPATDTGNIPGYTPVYENGKLRFIENKPRVSVQIGGQTIGDVDPDTAATVAGHIAGEQPKGGMTANEVYEGTEKYWDKQISLTDKTYGMQDSRGNMIINPADRDKWLAARKKIEDSRLQDLYDISGGKKPSWMTSKPADQGKADQDKQVQDFIQQFGGGD